MTLHTLVLGGARSGKSAHAEGLLPAEGRASYLATAQPNPADAEWTARIAAHVARRPASWQTVEVGAPGHLAELLDAAGPSDPPLLVDDVATWLTGLLDATDAWTDPVAARPVVDAALAELVASVANCAGRLVLVSAEVGLGVVPATGSGRLFRDLLGSLNARLAQVCDEAVLLVAGLTVELKSSRR